MTCDEFKSLVGSDFFASTRAQRAAVSRHYCHCHSCKVFLDTIRHNYAQKVGPKGVEEVCKGVKPVFEEDMKDQEYRETLKKKSPNDL